MKNNNLLRWISVIPGSFIAGFLALFPLHWILYTTLVHGETISGVNIEPIEHFISPIITMITAILISFKIAPKYKFKTSVAIAILWILFILIGILFMPERIYLETRTIFTFIAILLALYINWSNYKKSEFN